MSDVEIEQKREEDERLDTAEDPNEEVRPTPPAYKRVKLLANMTYTQRSQNVGALAG
jgi:polyadenylate-binding protein 2